jgi:hypothetical protein
MQIKGKRGINLFVAHTINFSQNSALYMGLYTKINAEVKEKRGHTLQAGLPHRKNFEELKKVFYPSPPRLQALPSNSQKLCP